MPLSLKFFSTDSAMSWRNKRVTGIVLFVTGVVFAFLTYFVNNSVPGSIQGNVVEQMCVSGVKHINYEKWVRLSSIIYFVLTSVRGIR